MYATICISSWFTICLLPKVLGVLCQYHAPIHCRRITGRDTRRLYCVGGAANIHARPQDCAKAQLKHSVRVLSFLARSQDVSGAGSHEMISKAATCVAICLLLCVSDCGSQELGKSCCIDVKRQRKTSIVYRMCVFQPH